MSYYHAFFAFFHHDIMPYQSDIEILVTLAPLVIGGLFYLLQFTLLYVLRYKRDPYYDPRPFRVWYAVAWLNLVFAPAWSLEYEMIPFNTAVILFVFLMYLYNECPPDYYSTLDQWA